MRWWDFYNIPLVKQLVRLTLSFLYVCLYSNVMLNLAVYHVADDDDDLHAGLGAASLARRMLRGGGAGVGDDDEGEGEPEPVPERPPLMSTPPTTLGVGETLVLLWTLSIALDEWYKWVKLPSTFSISSWGVFNYIYLAVTLVGFGLRLTVSAGLGQAVLAFNLILGWCRILQDLMLHRGLGVLVIMIQSMLSDIVLWLIVSSLFFAGFVIAFGAISVAGADLNEVFGLPLWAMLGAFEPSTVDDFSMDFAVGESLLWMYVMVSNVLLVNLLIAMMGDTFSRIKENADMEWKFARLASGIEYVERVHPIPPPLSLPIMIYNLYRWLFQGFEWETEGDGIDDGKDEWDENGRLWLAKREKDAIDTVLYAPLPCRTRARLITYSRV